MRLQARVVELRDRAAHAAFRQCPFDESWHVEASAARSFEFGPAYPVAAFWLPTSFGRFYPDFVCELTAGRLLVVEYKGAQIASMPKEIEKG